MLSAELPRPLAGPSGDPSEYRRAPHEFDYDRYWSAKIRGVENAETRAPTGMGEDIVSGPGAGHRIVGQVWSSQVVNLIRAHSFSDRVGATIMPLHNEITNLPQFLADVAPMWIGEGGAVSADVSPQVSPLVFNAAGAVLDLAPVSRNLVDDAINTGGVNGLVMNSVAMKYARLIDMAVLYGMVGSVGNPGMCASGGHLPRHERAIRAAAL